MGKRKQYVKIACKCDKSEYEVTCICEEGKVDEMKHRCLLSMVDFVDLTAAELTMSMSVEPTTDVPEKDVDLYIKKLNLD